MLMMLKKKNQTVPAHRSLKLPPKYFAWTWYQLPYFLPTKCCDLSILNPSQPGRKWNTSSWNRYRRNPWHCEQLPIPLSPFAILENLQHLDSGFGPQQIEGKVKAILNLCVTVGMRQTCLNHNWDKLLPSNRNTITKIQGFESHSVKLLGKAEKNITAKDIVYLQLRQILRGIFLRFSTSSIAKGCP